MGARQPPLPHQLVDHERTGLHVAPGDIRDLRQKLAWACGHPDEMARMGAAARDEYRRRYHAEASYESLMRVYAAAAETFRTRAPRTP